MARPLTRLQDGEPLAVHAWEGDLIPGFEQAVLGMAPGESKTHTIPAQQAYGITPAGTAPRSRACSSSLTTSTLTLGNSYR